MTKFSRLMMIAFMCVCLAGCGAKSDDDKNSPQGVTGEVVQNSVTQDKTADENQNLDGNTNESGNATSGNEDTGSTSSNEGVSTINDTASENQESGVYYISGNLQSSKKSESGKPDQSGVLQAIIYEAGINGDSLRIVGTTNFRNFMDQDVVGVNPEEVIELKLTESTTYLCMGGEDGSQEMTKEEFAQTLQSCLDSGLLLDIQVSNGEAAVIMLCS
jgi:hypothetical protein